MTTTQLIKLLKENEFGGATKRARQIYFKIADRIVPTDGIEVAGTGDGLFTELYLSLPSATCKDKLAEREWIPVTEALPNDDNDYLVMGDEGVCAVGWYRHDAKAWDSCEFGWLENRNDPPYGIGTVVAWMPLPRPYDPQESEGKK